MKKCMVLLIALLLSLFTASNLFAQPELIQAQEGDDPRLKLVISYQKNEEEKPFLIITYRDNPGFVYNIAAPYLEGYAPDRIRLQGKLTEDTEKAVFYYPQTYLLTVHYRLLDGETAAPDDTQRGLFGEEYLITPPYVPGYKPITTELKGTIPGRDTELTVFYVDLNTIIQ